MFGLDQNDKEFLKVAGLGLVFLVIALVKLYQRTRLQRNGIATEGTVIRVEREGHRSHTYYPVVRFLTPEQKWITARYDVGSNPASFTEGETVQVQFDPADPTCFIINSDNSSFLLWLFTLIGIGVTAYGVVQYINA